MNRQFTAEHLQFLRKQKIHKITVHVTQVVVLFIMLAVWELAAQLGWIDSFITSSPSRIWATLKELVADGTIFRHAWVSTV